MKTEMRRALAQQSFEEKIRKVGQLIQLSAAMKSHRVREEDKDAAEVVHPADACSKPAQLSPGVADEDRR